MLDRKIIGRNIANFRRQRELTQKELAQLLQITAQSISKWEAGQSIPTVDMLYDLAGVLKVSMDLLVGDEQLENRDICYLDTGLDTNKLYQLKDVINTLITSDERVLHAHYIDPFCFRAAMEDWEEPEFSLITNVPGSKARLARELGYDREICLDVAARAINHTLRMGMNPLALQAHVVCGNKDSGQLQRMAESFKEICEANNILFGGMEIACQPVNFHSDEYELMVALVGGCDRKEREKRCNPQNIKEGDVLLGMMSDGIEASSYPFVRIMLNQRPELLRMKTRESHYFEKELLKPNSVYLSAVRELWEAELLHGLLRCDTSLLYDSIYEGVLPEGLGACIRLSSYPVKPLYRFLQENGMVGKRNFHYRFSMGFQLIAIVAPEQAERASRIIKQYHECYSIGKIEKNNRHAGKRVWTEGKIPW